jgi:hypothetical protein
MSPRFRVFKSWGAVVSSEIRPGTGVTRAVLGALVLGGGGLATVGCARERPWAISEAPPMRLEAGDERARTVVRPEDDAAIREVAVELAGGAEAWDGTPRLIDSGSPWAAVREALAAAGDREGIECVVARMLEDGSGDAWDFELMTIEREPGRFRVERVEPGEPGGAEARGFTIVRAELGRRPDAPAMQRRTARLVAAFKEEMQRRGEALRFAEVGGGS